VTAVGSHVGLLVTTCCDVGLKRLKSAGGLTARRKVRMLPVERKVMTTRSEEG
jgi:hypothetical protein